MGHYPRSEVKILASRTYGVSLGRSRTLATTHPKSEIEHTRRKPPDSLVVTLPKRPTKQPSRTKLKDYYDIDIEADMDIDLDDIQYYMREEEHTRSEGRRR